MENPSQPTGLTLPDAKLGLSDVLLFLIGYLSRLDTKANWLSLCATVCSVLTVLAPMFVTLAVVNFLRFVLRASAVIMISL